MTYYQEKQFYENDKKEYELENNLNFLKWYLNAIDTGFKCECKIGVCKS